MGRIDAILRAISGQPLAIMPEKLERIIGFLQLRADGMRVAEEEVATMEAAVQERRGRMTKTADGVALIPLIGTVSHRTTRGLSDGGAKLDAFNEAFDAALASSDIGTIVIDCDGPGGGVPYVAETAEKVFAARKEKRIISVANTLAASATYWIYSAASERVVSPSGEIGSIGVFMVHVDWSAMLENEGFKPTLVRSGKYKAEGHPYFQLSEDAEGAYQRICDDYYEMFTDGVAKHFGRKATEVRDGFGEGRVLTARRAVAEKMADRVATLDEVLSELGVSRGAAPAQGLPAAPSISLVGLRGLHTSAGLLPVSGTEAMAGGADAGDAAASAVILLPSSTNAPEADGAAPEATTPPAETASAAKETSAMSTSTAVAPAPTGPDMQTITSIRTLAVENGWSEADAFTLAISGVTEDAAAKQILNRKAAAQVGTQVRVTVGDDRAAARPFASFGEQMMCIVRAGQPGGSVDPRLNFGAGPSGASSGTAADGGFLIQSEFSSEIVKRVYDTGEIAKRVRKIPIGPGKNGLKMNAVDEDSRANGARFGGITMYWENEADAAVATKPKFRRMEMELRKLMGAMYATEELLEDATALEAVASDAFSEEATFKVEDAIFRGPGAGVPLGLMKSDARIAVAKEAGQAAGTINTANVNNMWGRLWARSRLSAVWLINQDAESQLSPLTQTGDAAHPNMLYQEPGTNGNVYGKLKGRDVIPVEYSETLGTEGDIMLVDLNQYLLIDKGGLRRDWSMHVRFLYDEQVFKIVYRVDGQPIWNKPLTPYKGSKTVSPIITLATRA